MIRIEVVVFAKKIDKSGPILRFKFEYFTRHSNHLVDTVESESDWSNGGRYVNEKLSIEMWILIHDISLYCSEDDAIYKTAQKCAIKL